MNDRQRIESAIIPALIYATVKNMEVYQKTNQEKEDHRYITETAYHAYYYEPVMGMMQNDQAQIRRRLNRLYQKLAPLMNEHTNGKCMMIIYYMLEGLIQDGRVSVYDGTPFAKAMEMFLEPIQELFRQGKLDQSAQKQADRLMTAIKAEGYFK